MLWVTEEVRISSCLKRVGRLHRETDTLISEMMIKSTTDRERITPRAIVTRLQNARDKEKCPRVLMDRE